MRQWKLRVVIVSCISLLLSAITPACSQTPATTEEQPVSQRPAEFEVGPIKCEPDTVMVNDSVTATVAVKNTGDIAGTYAAVFAINGQEIDKKDITVEPGNTNEISFQFSKASPGNYNLAIGNSSTTLTVHEWELCKIQYDEADGAQFGIYVAGEAGHIVHFTPPAKAFSIQKIRVFGTSGVLNTLEFDWNQFTVRIWDKERENQLWSQDLPWRLFMPGDCWREIKVPDVRVNDDFYVEIVTHSHPSSFIPGTETPSPGGAPVEALEINPFGGIGSGTGIIVLGTGSPISGPGARGVIIIGFDRPKSYTTSNRPETRSGYSYMGKPFETGKGALEGIRWLIRVEGEGAASN